MTPLDKQRVALIFGATGDLGREVAQLLAGAGFKVVLSGRDIGRLEALYDTIDGGNGPPPALYPMDLAGAAPADYDELAQRMETEYGRLDLLVFASANFECLKAMEQTAPEDWVLGLHVNLTAPWLTTQSCLPLLRQSAPSQVVFVSPDPEQVQQPFWGAYGVASGGLQALHAILEREVRSSGVAIHRYLPPPIDGRLRARAWKDDQSNETVDAEQAARGLMQLIGQKPAHRAQD